jgi:hypothetical protein
MEGAAAVVTSARTALMMVAVVVVVVVVLVVMAMAVVVVGVFRELAARRVAANLRTRAPMTAAESFSVGRWKFD